MHDDFHGSGVKVIGSFLFLQSSFFKNSLRKDDPHIRVLAAQEVRPLTPRKSKLFNNLLGQRSPR